MFSADLDHRQRLQASTLGHRFARLRDVAGVPDATLHRLRHGVATFLVSRGQILQMQHIETGGNGSVLTASVRPNHHHN